MNKFIFMMCTERSGSNFMARLMNGHSQISGPSPSHLFRILNENICRYQNLSLDENWSNLLSDTVSLLETNLGSWKADLSYSALSNGVKERSLPALLAFVYSEEAKANGKEYSYIKENHVYRYYPFINENFDRPKFVYLVRDPRDMALSWKNAPNGRGCVVRAVDIWKQDQSAGLHLLNSLRTTGRIHCLRYEDLVRKPDEKISEVCEFLNLAYEPAMLDLDKSAENLSYSEKTPEWNNVRRPVMTNNYDKYREGLSRDEICYVELVCWDEMHAFGYDVLYADEYSIDQRAEVIEKLKATLMPYEENEKKAYQEQSEEVKARHAMRVSVLNAIKAREYGRVV